jgi:hypothetical protein
MNACHVPDLEQRQTARTCQELGDIVHLHVALPTSRQSTAIDTSSVGASLASTCRGCWKEVGAMTWTAQGVERMMCGLRGHDEVLNFERHRLSLRCLSCGHETAGWMLQPEPRHPAPLTEPYPHHRALPALRTLLHLSS